MKIFISHSSTDIDIVKAMHKVLTDFDIKVWVDFNKIDEGNPIFDDINEGFKDATYFFLIWSKAASTSNWVKMETNTVLSKPYVDNIKRIPFLLDETPLGVGFAPIIHHKISKDNVKSEIKKFLNKIRSDLEFNSQLKLFRATVCDHYENIPEKPNRPVISNFRKFDGHKYYVQQPYHDLTVNSHPRGEMIGKHVLSLIKRDLDDIQLKKQIKQQLRTSVNELSSLESKGIDQQILTLVRNANDLYQIKRQVLLNMNLEEHMIDEVLELDQQNKEIKKMKRKLKSSESEIRNEDINEIKKRECDPKPVTKPEHSQILEYMNKQMININKIRKMIDKIDSLKKRLNRIPNDNIIPIVGDYGSGKSALCHYLMYSICNKGFEKYIPIFVPLGQVPRHEELKDYLMKDIYDYVKKEYEFNLEYDEFNNNINDGNVILILDALDEASNKLDNTIAQTNLDHVIELSKKCVTIVTSRHTYLTTSMEEKLLIDHKKLIKILDFSNNEIDRYLGLYLKEDTQRIKEIRRVIDEDKLQDLARKPLFLNVICDKFEELKEYFPINESVILQVLTDEWIKHDVETKQDLDIDEKEKTMNERQRISEILACKEYEKGTPIDVNEIMKEVKEELQYEYSEARERLNQYYKDAVTSTFLIKEENEKYRFILNPVTEYFVARRIIHEIRRKDFASFFKHINMISGPEIFHFIRGIVDIEWAISSHVFRILSHYNEDKKLKNYENQSLTLFNLVNEIRNGKYNQKPGNLVKILYITGNLPPRPDLHDLDLTAVDLSNSNLYGSDMRFGIFHQINLRGSNLQKANLYKAKMCKATLSAADLSGADLSGADLSGADLSNANMKEADLTETNLSNSNLYGANLTGVIATKTKLYEANLSYSNLSGADLSNAFVGGGKFIGVDLQNTKLPLFLQKVDFRQSILIKMNLDRFDLSYADLREANLTNIRLQHAKMINTDLRWAKIINADLFKATLIGAKLYGADFQGTNIDSTDLSGANQEGAINLSSTGASEGW